MSVKAYKGFNKDMTCRGFQFKEGEIYHEDEAKLCEKGFHACLDPLDCFRYYSPAKSVFHEVELDELTDEKSHDSKICGKTLKVNAKLDIAGLIKAKFEYTKSKCNSANNGGDCSVNAGLDNSANNGGDYSVNAGLDNSANNGGDYSVNAGRNGSANNGGDCSVNAGRNGSAKSKENGVCVERGMKGKVSGGLGSLLVIAIENEEHNIINWNAAIVDGEKIKPDTWYTLKDGEFVEVSEEESE